MTNNTPPSVVLILAALAMPGFATADTCHPADKKGTECTLPVDDLHPTQFAVGSIAVDCKADKISGLSKKKLKAYLKKEKNRIPAVVGPDGNFYITDHHHLATALYRASSSDWKKKDKVVSIDVLDNYFLSKTDWGEFWQAMQDQHLSYNYDNKGLANMNFALLPGEVGMLLNDPYRTLSRWVRESCGYLKLGKEQCDAIRPDPPHQAPFFMEFYWGEFFRENLPLSIADQTVCQSIPYSDLCLHDQVDQLKGIYPQAMALAGSEQAKLYFEKLSLDPYAYGYNPTGQHLDLKFGGEQNACEEVEEED